MKIMTNKAWRKQILQKERKEKKKKTHGRWQEKK